MQPHPASSKVSDEGSAQVGQPFENRQPDPSKTLAALYEEIRCQRDSVSKNITALLVMIHFKGKLRVPKDIFRNAYVGVRSWNHFGECEVVERFEDESDLLANLENCIDAM